MDGNVPVAEATSNEAVLPERVQEALGQLVGAAKQGLLALSVEVGLGVLSELLEQEVDELVGSKGKWNRERAAVRHGHEDGEVTLGGRRVGVERPEKVDDAKRPNPRDENSLACRCFLPRPYKNILAALALIWASETNVGDNPLPEIVGCSSNGAGRQFHHDRPLG